MLLILSICILVFTAAGLAVFFYKTIKNAVSGRATFYLENIRLLVSKSIADIKGSEIIKLEIAAGIVTLAVFLISFDIMVFIIAVPVMIYLPAVYVKVQRDKYIKQYYDGLPGFLESITSNLKAGLSLVKAFRIYAAQDAGPNAAEISIVLKKAELGRSLQEALQELAEKIPLKENEIIVSAVNTAIETGGNITEVLENILETIRKRDELGREVKALTSQGVLSGIIVGLLPVFLIVAVSFIDPGFMEPMFTTAPGRVMLAVAVLMELTGAFAISRIINVK